MFGSLLLRSVIEDVLVYNCDSHGLKTIWIQASNILTYDSTGLDLSQFNPKIGNRDY